MCKKAIIAMALGLGLLAAGLPAQAQSPQRCGGADNRQCGAGEACRYPEGQCNTPDLAGVCVAVDNVCPKQGPKVCGCDGTTYANECELLKAGVRQVRKGDCGPDSKGAKVCSNNPDCTGTGELCELPAGTCGGTGRCIVAPDVCQNVLAPVCGCDNKTYRNDCERRRAGVSLKAAGECTGAGS